MLINAARFRPSIDKAVNESHLPITIINLCVPSSEVGILNTLRTLTCFRCTSRDGFTLAVWPLRASTSANAMLDSHSGVVVAVP
ncbi:unnamed protein product [Linum trigynum]|uniref:Uncharacterized protein n=1 Tax=Linum trigynum TaxID=586398 RepID=A0AAV2EG92_9ROSI